MLKNKKVLITIIVFIGLAAGLILVQSPQLYEKKAQVPLCPERGASCRWDSLGEGISYKYEITDITLNTLLVRGTTVQTRILFTPIINHKYRCKVYPVSSCGQGPETQAENTCTIIITPTPSPTPVAIVTSVLTSTPEPPIGGVVLPSVTPFPTLSMIPEDSTFAAILSITAEEPLPSLSATSVQNREELSPTSEQEEPSQPQSEDISPAWWSRVLVFVAFGLVLLTVAYGLMKKFKHRV